MPAATNKPAESCRFQILTLVGAFLAACLP